MIPFLLRLTPVRKGWAPPIPGFEFKVEVFFESNAGDIGEGELEIEDKHVQSRTYNACHLKCQAL
jgi:hypothetical protein